MRHAACSAVQCASRLVTLVTRRRARARENQAAVLAPTEASATTATARDTIATESAGPGPTVGASSQTIMTSRAAAPAVPREQVEAFIIDQRDRNSPQTAHVRFGGLQQFRRWAEEEQIVGDPRTDSNRPTDF